MAEEKRKSKAKRVDIDDLSPKDALAGAKKRKPRKEQILDVARDLFLTQGIEGVTMRKIASAVGISAPAIYRHFKNKDDVLAALVIEGRRIFASYLFQALEAPTPKKRLWLTGKLYLDFGFENPEYYRVFFMAWDRLDPDKHGQRSPEETSPPPAFQFLLDRIQECLRSGDLAPDTNIMEVALLCWGQCHGLTNLYLTGGVRHQMTLEQYRALCDGVLRRLFEGLFGTTLDE